MSIAFAPTKKCSCTDPIHSVATSLRSNNILTKSFPSESPLPGIKACIVGYVSIFEVASSTRSKSIKQKANGIFYNLTCKLGRSSVMDDN